MKLSGTQFDALSKALTNAFDLDELESMVRKKLGEELENITNPGPKWQVVEKLIRWCERKNKVRTLVNGAYAENPDNLILRDIKFRILEEYFDRTAVDESDDALERLVQRSSQFVDTATFLGRGAEIQAQVCKVEVPVGHGQVISGTGFLVGPDVVLTNYHIVESVIPSGQYKTAAKGQSFLASQVVLRFDYKRNKDGNSINPGTEYKLAPVDWLIYASPSSLVDKLSDPGGQTPHEEELDFVLLRVDDSPGHHVVGRRARPGANDGDAIGRGWIALPKDMPDITTDTTVLIMQHPSGQSLKLAIGSDAIIGLNQNSTRLRYRVSTSPGSSGSPVFNINWDLIALHNSGDPNFEHAAEYNSGIPVNMIYALLAKYNKLDALNGGD